VPQNIRHGPRALPDPLAGFRGKEEKEGGGRGKGRRTEKDEKGRRRGGEGGRRGRGNGCPPPETAGLYPPLDNTERLEISDRMLDRLTPCIGEYRVNIG